MYNRCMIKTLSIVSNRHVRGMLVGILGSEKGHDVKYFHNATYLMSHFKTHNKLETGSGLRLPRFFHKFVIATMQFHTNLPTIATHSHVACLPAYSPRSMILETSEAFVTTPLISKHVRQRCHKLAMVLAAVVVGQFVELALGIW